MRACAACWRTRSGRAASPTRRRSAKPAWRQLQATLASIGKSSDPLRQEARRLIEEGNVAGGETKLDEALDADEKAIAEAGAGGGRSGARQPRRARATSPSWPAEGMR